MPRKAKAKPRAKVGPEPVTIYMWTEKANAVTHLSAVTIIAPGLSRDMQAILLRKALKKLGVTAKIEPGGYE